MDRIFKWPDFIEIAHVIRSLWSGLVDTSFNEIKFSNSSLAIKIGLVLCLLLVFKFLVYFFGSKKYLRKDSGYLFCSDGSMPAIVRVFFLVPYIGLVACLGLILAALADPYLSFTTEEKIYVETRIRIDVRDVSGSMTVGTYGDTSITPAEMAMKAHLKFLELRRGKKDRVSLWMFSNNPYMVHDFIIDDDLLYFEAYNMVWELRDFQANKLSWYFTEYPLSRSIYISGEGGTVLGKLLEAAIEKFDEDEKRNKNSFFYRKNAKRAITIITDAGIADLDETKTQLRRLARKNINPYIILLNMSTGTESLRSEIQNNGFLRSVISNGGKIFPVSSEADMIGAYKEIDRSEIVKAEIKKKNMKVSVFQRFLFVAFMLLLLILFLAFAQELLKFP